MKYRNLTSSEIDQLERLGNWADDWSAVQVAEPFCAECLRGNSFEGAVRLGAIAQGRVVHGDLSLREGIVTPTIHLDTPDPECDLDYTPNVAVEAPVTLGISDSLGFGGHNACIAFRNFE